MPVAIPRRLAALGVVFVWLVASRFCADAAAQTVPALSSPEAVTRAWSSDRFRRATLPPAEQPAPLPRQALRQALERDAQALLQRPGMIALLMIDRGRVVFEGYDKGATETDRLLSFSMAKTMTALAVGEAHCAGRIPNLDERADLLAPTLAGTAFGEASVRDLLRMASGARAGAGSLHGQPRPEATSDLLRGRVPMSRQLREHGQRASTLFGEVRPGTRFAYSNLDTDALSLVVEATTGEPFAQWFGRTVAGPAGLEASSFWLLDGEGRAAAHVGYLASLRDWGRLALRMLALRDGTQGSACMQGFVADATRRQLPTWATNSLFEGYGYQTWLDARGMPPQSFWMLGFGGQRIGIDPVSGRILVGFAWQPDDGVFQLFRNWARGS